MSNPFEDPEACYVVLVNDENQHSLWPARIAGPEGWTVAHDEDTREACLAFVDRNWTDLMPRSATAG
ncbi:MbtH family protein [Streptomyces cinnamoneus]|uniref:MbtH family protein n=1 Tax=Streptomyces cinnamoneus TaxID=53446 RepID=A0A2G1XN45_STRCJ|nr:MbtH family protein [Streptomyces cinnamoneus]PHQ52675.1 MbtH family protein [Streptomyces cinnamoneus]PPT12109.1 MbtH family protein [Streptomyces cinnamoneus]